MWPPPSTSCRSPPTTPAPASCRCCKAAWIACSSTSPASDALLRGEVEPLPLTPAQLQHFVAPEGWPLRALRAHFRRDSLVLRHAVRMSLALATAYYLALALPWARIPTGWC